MGLQIVQRQTKLFHLEIRWINKAWYKYAPSTFGRCSGTLVSRGPVKGSKALKIFAVPCLFYSGSYLSGFPGSAKRGARTALMSWVDISSLHTWGHDGLYGFL